MPDQEGRFAIVTNVGLRDAMDAAASPDERRQRGRRSRVVLMPRRWHQVLKKLTLLRDDGGKKARSPERARSKPLKPIVQEKPDCSGGPVVTTLVSFIFSDARLRVRMSIRLFLRPLLDEGPIPAKLGQNMPRECGATSRRLFEN